jgi:hypothetical protein
LVSLRSELLCLTPVPHATGRGERFGIICNGLFSLTKPCRTRSYPSLPSDEIVSRDTSYQLGSVPPWQTGTPRACWLTSVGLRVHGCVSLYITTIPSNLAKPEITVEKSSFGIVGKGVLEWPETFYRKHSRRVKEFKPDDELPHGSKKLDFHYQEKNRCKKIFVLRFGYGELLVYGIILQAGPASMLYTYIATFPPFRILLRWSPVVLYNAMQASPCERSIVKSSDSRICTPKRHAENQTFISPLLVSALIRARHPPRRPCV